MDLEKIKALIDLLAQSPLAKLEVIEGDERVKLIKTKQRRAHNAASAAQSGVVKAVRDEVRDEVREAVRTNASSQSAADTTGAADARAAAPEVAKAVCAPSPVKTQNVLAPMAGIAHLKPSPDEVPFVAVGDAVSEGQVLCTIEAMKMFIAVESMHDGVVEAILVEPGTEVSAGQPLFRIG